MKKFLLAALICTLAFTACNDDDDNNDPKPRSIVLTATDATLAGEPYSAVAIINAVWESQDYLTEVLLASGTFNNSFNLTLPGTLPASVVLSTVILPTGVTATPSEFKGLANSLTEYTFITHFNAYNASEEYIGVFELQDDGNFIMGGCSYFDRDVNITGSYIFESAIEVTLDINAVYGWNMLYRIYTVPSSNEEPIKMLFTSTPPTSPTLKWHFKSGR